MSSGRRASAAARGQAIAPVFRAWGLTKTYGSGQTQVRALIDVDLEIRRGEFIVLLGASDSGRCGRTPRWPARCSGAYSPRPVEVETAGAVIGALESTIDADARTRVTERYVVSAPLAARNGGMA